MTNLAPDMSDKIPADLGQDGRDPAGRPYGVPEIERGETQNGRPITPGHIALKADLIDARVKAEFEQAAFVTPDQK